MDNLLKVLPMAVVMVAGPQIVSAILLATSARPLRDSAAFIAGATLATTIGVTAAYLLSSTTAASTRGARSDVIDYGIIVLLLILIVVVFRKRRDTRLPNWMSDLQTATRRFSFNLGFLLFFVMPSDIVTMMTVGAYAAHHGSPWWQTLPFILLTAMLVGLPVVVLLVLGKRATVILPRIRDWIDTNSWIVNEIVIGFFLVYNRLWSGERLARQD
jgi:cytochrome c biogenesis protein CcdA